MSQSRMTSSDVKNRDAVSIERVSNGFVGVMIECASAGKHWTTTLYLEPQLETPRWKLPDTVRGQLDTSAHLAYWGSNR